MASSHTLTSSTRRLYGLFLLYVLKYNSLHFSNSQFVSSGLLLPKQLSLHDGNLQSNYIQINTKLLNITYSKNSFTNLVLIYV